MKTKFLVMTAVIIICCFNGTKSLAQTNNFTSKAILTFVNAPADDAEENLTTGMTNIHSSDLRLGSAGKSDQLIGLRFTNIKIPQGAIISSARLVYNVDELKDGWNHLEIHAENVDNATAFEATNRNITSRVKTQAVVNLDQNSEWQHINGSYTSPNIAPVIQEVVNRSGWEEMNSIALLLKGSGESSAIAFDGNPNLPPMLIINYLKNENTFTNAFIFTNDEIINQNLITKQKSIQF